MKNYKGNKIYSSLIVVLVLFGVTNLFALESKSLSDGVVFKTEKPQETSEQFVELASDNSYNAQPVVHVKDSSIEESSAAKARKRREEAEIRTEQKIAETLEKARLADEKRRAERLFGGKIQPNTYETPKAVVPQGNTRLQTIEKKLSDIQTNLFNQEFDKLQQDSGRYVGLNLGVAQYNVEGLEFAKDVTTKSVFGISTGMRMEDNPFITLDGHFLFSQHVYKNTADLDNNYYFPQVNQYNAGLSLKYDVIPFVITPRLGASIDYTFRQYFMESSFDNPSKKLDTHSVEVGLMAGGYIQVSKRLGIEISYTQMTNISTSARDNLYNPGGANNIVNLLDRSSYGIFLISLQMGFQ